MKTIPACILFVALTILSARAFPPAPYYILYGTVRDQVGQKITAEGAEIVLLKGGVEIGRTPIASNIQIDQNYELKIRTDGKTWTSAPIAITPAGQRFAAHLAPAVAILPLHCDPQPGAVTELYRLKVR